MKFIQIVSVDRNGDNISTSICWAVERLKRSKSWHLRRILYVSLITGWDGWYVIVSKKYSEVVEISLILGYYQNLNGLNSEWIFTLEYDILPIYTCKLCIIISETLKMPVNIWVQVIKYSIYVHSWMFTRNACRMSATSEYSFFFIQFEYWLICFFCCNFFPESNQAQFHRLMPWFYRELLCLGGDQSQTHPISYLLSAKNWNLDSNLWYGLVWIPEPYSTSGAESHWSFHPWILSMSKLSTALSKIQHLIKVLAVMITKVEAYSKYIYLAPFK